MMNDEDKYEALIDWLLLSLNFVWERRERGRDRDRVREKERRCVCVCGGGG